MNKRLNILILLIVLISLASFSVHAATIGDAFGNVLDNVEEFFRGGWQDYEKTIIFFVFFFLFFPAYLIGMKKAMGELNRPHIVFAFTAAFLSAFIIVISVGVEWVNLKYIAWGLIAFLLFFLIYTLLSKMGLENKKFWLFLLALILTALLLWLIWYLMQEGRTFDNFGRFTDWIKDVGKGGEGKKVAEDLWPGGVAPRPRTVEPPATPAGPKEEEGGGVWGWVKGQPTYTKIAVPLGIAII